MPGSPSRSSADGAVSVAYSATAGTATAGADFTPASGTLNWANGDSGNKTITLEGKASCAATGRKDVPMKTVLRLLSPDKHVLEMFDGTQGNAKTMEITYTRR